MYKVFAALAVLAALVTFFFTLPTPAPGSGPSVGDSSVIGKELEDDDEGPGADDEYKRDFLDWTWVPVSDQRMGGQSEAGVESSDQAIKVVANVRPGFVFPFAGVALPLDQPAVAEVLADEESQVRGFSLRASGATGTYQIMFIEQNQTGIPKQVPVELSEDTREFEIMFDEVNVVVENVAVISLVSTDSAEYQIEGLRWLWDL